MEYIDPLATLAAYYNKAIVNLIPVR